jgi:hypothetical protein
MFWAAPEDKWTVRNYSLKLSLELMRNSNFDELVIAAYGYELSYWWVGVTWMVAVLLRGYREDESMIDGRDGNMHILAACAGFGVSLYPWVRV